ISGAFVSFLKVDVEGAELDVLEGSRATIRRHLPLVMCEVIEAHQGRFCRSSQDIVTFFDALDYQGFRLGNDQSRRDRVQLTPIKPLAQSSTEDDNALFVPASRVDEVLNTILGERGRPTDVA